MSYQSLPPPSASAANGLDRLFARVMGWVVWGVLALMGLVFALSLFAWLTALVLVSLVASVFTGRPAAVTVLWRRYRDLTSSLARQRWPQGDRRASATPRADAASQTGAATPSSAVQDVGWREVAAPRANDGAGHSPSHS